MRFNRNITLILLLTTVGLSGIGSTAAARRPPLLDEVKEKNDTGCVEVLKAKRGGDQCKGTTSLSVRCKVACSELVDVQICIKTNKGWSCSNYSNKQSGDELSAYECRATGAYAILKREAGSNLEWPKP